MTRLSSYGPAHEDNADHQMDTWEAGEQRGDPTNDVMEDRQQPEMFQILVDKWLSSGLNLSRVIGKPEVCGRPC
ncbi:MAG: hypothetical protein ACLQNE_41255 [Thermoguttaceae bacterium]